ncbi:hypothetical protein [Halopseudomonas yangmingensis]|uniref:hypothetical protein n=1 Tax=Halopseudomonas yangmingensis TaxID=1720063 RepID=UPI001160D1FA|nr:hypothetical protein [Halopseudomonas yangmingensis]
MINPISEINIIVTTITANSGNILFNYFLQECITPGSRAGLEPRSGGKSVAVQPIVKACQASTEDVAGHVQQPEPGNHQASLGKRWKEGTYEGEPFGYLAATRLAKLSVMRQANWPTFQIPQ